MSQLESTPVLAAPAPESDSAPIEPATASATAPVTETATAPETETAAAAAPTIEAQVDSEPAGAPEPAAVQAGESHPVEKKGARGARKGRGRTKPRRGVVRDEVVAPTPEDLAGIHSEKVRLAIEAGHPVEGLVIGWNQGGFHVAVDGVTAFCPRSSMELGGPKEPSQYLDKTLVFRVLRVEEKGHRLVLSHAAMQREERKQAAEDLRRKLEVGSVVHGRVISLTDFGAFVDLGGIEGMVHVSEIRHVRVAHPKDALHVGQEIDAKVLKLAAGADRISLSIRALEPDPWDGVAQRHPAGGRFSGKVLRKSEFGWFVELEPGVEGLLHTSQLLPGMNAEDARLAPGATLEGWVREVDGRRKRISLALRETPQGDPWQGVEKKYAEGAVVKGKVEKLEKFGAFIELEPGLTGLLPQSEMGLPRGANIGRAYSPGKEVKVQVAHVDPRRKRISLTIEGKTLEGSRSDFQAYVKQTRKATGLGALAAALQKARQPEG